MAVIAMGYAAVRPLASYRAIELGASGLALGVLAASFAIGPLLGAVPLGRLVDRIGTVPVLLTGIRAMPAILAGTALVRNVYLLCLLSAVIGLLQLASMITLQAQAAHRATGTDLDHAYGWLTAGASVGQAAGPVITIGLGTVIASLTGASPTTCGLAVTAAIAGASWMLGELTQRRHRAEHATPPTRSTPMPIRTIIAMPGMRPALLASGTVLASLDLLIAFLPAWAEERGVSMLTVAWLLAIRATISVAVRLVQSHVVRAVGRRATIAAAILAAVAGLASLPLANQYTAVAAMVLLGVGLALPQPLTLSWVVASVPAGSRGSTLGARLLSNRLAQAAIPLAVGAVASGSGTAGVFLTCAAILTATSAAVARAPMRDPDG